MPKRFLCLVLFLQAMLLCLTGSLATAQDAPLKVGTFECPPFSIRDEDGQHRGLSIYLWQEIARQIGASYEIVDMSLGELLSAAEDGTIDVGASCVSITEPREEVLDFSHAFYETHLAIAVREASLLTTVGNFLSDGEVLYWLGIVLLLACIVGGVYYLLEHRDNPTLYTRESRSGKMFEGFLLGLLSVTSGPLDYFEFRSLTGRAITAFLAVLTTVFIASFTAILASAFTFDRLRSDIAGPHDLADVNVGVKETSTASNYLDAQRIGYRTYPTIPDMLDALYSGEIDAVVTDDPVLRYEIHRGQQAGTYRTLTVLPQPFERQNYGFVLPEESPLGEAIDRALLSVRNTSGWDAALGRYLGSAE
ncbi:transporter substrate-binding domain-containing protein [Pseudoruegeria sp. HB172150]|uniref:transporter substrate-binding domain-containing protein n=1 Tax=Pseudoruegeria sp. HB172150 TaxID=2721164 RepID=UPI001C12D906|nr:transporter substrate-binding domain-containing protein [Pseudoruegeria sp. HB172150]